MFRARAPLRQRPDTRLLDSLADRIRGSGYNGKYYIALITETSMSNGPGRMVQALNSRHSVAMPHIYTLAATEC